MSRYNKFLSIFIALIVLTGSISFSGFAFAEGNSAIMTTDSTGNVVNENHYNDKKDVFVRSHMLEGDFYIRVTDPSGHDILGESTDTIYLYDDYVFNLWDVVGGYLDTTNEGNEYKVWASRDPDFHPGDVKFDNFKVIKTPKYGSVEIVKVIVGDEFTEISGFKFELHQNGDRVYGPEETNSQGIALFEQVLLGEYEIVEILTEEQEELFEEPESKTVNVNEEGVKFQIEFTNTFKPETPPWKGNIRVEKQFEEGIDADLEDFEFEVWQDGSKVGESVFTDENGIAVFEDIEEGEYEVREVNHNGYIPHFPNGATVEVAPDNDNEDVFVVEVINRLVPDEPEEPEEPGGDDDDDDDTPPGGGGTTTPDDDDEEEDEDDEVQVLDEEDIDEDVPQSPPPIPPQPVIPLPVEPEEIVEVEEVEQVEEIEEETPQAVPVATLPKTGANNTFAYSGFGTILLGLGLFLKRRKNNI